MVVVTVVAAAAAHDDVVNELDVHDLAGLVDALGEAVILSAWVRVVTGMIVGQDDTRRQALDGGPQNHLDVGYGHGSAAAAHPHALLDLLGVVEQNDKHLLVVEVLHARAQILVSLVTAGDLEALLEFLLLIAARQFQGGENLDSLYLADAVVVLHQVVDSLAGDEVEFVVVVAQDALAQVNHRLARRAHPQQYGEQLGSGQAGKTMLLSLLARAVLLGNRVLDVARSRLFAVIFI